MTLFSSRTCVLSFQGMKVFFEVVASVYVLYLFFLIVRACSELRHMPYVGKRRCPAARGEVVGGTATGLQGGRRPPGKWLTWSGRTQRLVPLPQAGDQHLWSPGSHDRAEWTTVQSPGPAGGRSAGWN